jgi:ABC-2 type transport system ATP-binding protein
MSPIEVRDLRKRYTADARPAVDGVTFDVQRGEVYALLGHNGAGKTTTVEILEGHRRATSGTARVLGIDPASADRELRDRVGIVLQSSGVEPQLTVREALDVYGGCYRRRRATTELVELAGLDEKADARIGSLSGGQRRRLDLALAIVGSPEVLFLDEPTTGFDPLARRQAWQLVGRLCEGGTTVLLTTHSLDEAERLADRVGVLADGRLVAEGTPHELVADSTGTTITFHLQAGAIAEDLRSLLPEGAEIEGGRVAVSTHTPTTTLAAITAWAVDRGVELDGLTVGRPTLEEAFLRLAGDGAGVIAAPATEGEEERA